MASTTKDASIELKEITEGLARCNILPTDFAIKCEKREWKVHKFVLIMRSKFFEAACTKDFKEANQGFIELKEVDADCIEMLVEYLYSSDYKRSYSSEIDFHVKMCIMVDKFHMQALSLLATEYFKEAANTITMWHEEAGFCKAIKTAYKAQFPTKAIREHVVKLMIDNDIMGYITDKKKSTFEKTIGEVAGLGLELLKEQHARIAGGTPTQKHVLNKK